MKPKKTTPLYRLHKGQLPDLDNRVKYPFRDMQVGHYFDVPREMDHTIRVRASDYGRKNGHRYRVNRIQRKEDGILCVRVQRVA